MGRPKIALYDDRAFATRNSFTVAIDLGAFPASTGRVMALTSWIMSLVNPFKGMGVGRRRPGSIPILTNTSQNRMSAELTLSIRILHVVKLVTSMVTTRASSWGRSNPSLSSSSNVMTATSEHLCYLFRGFSIVNTSSYQTLRAWTFLADEVGPPSAYPRGLSWHVSMQ